MRRGRGEGRGGKKGEQVENKGGDATTPMENNTATHTPNAHTHTHISCVNVHLLMHSGAYHDQSGTGKQRAEGEAKGGEGEAVRKNRKEGVGKETEGNEDQKHDGETMRHQKKTQVFLNELVRLGAYHTIKMHVRFGAALKNRSAYTCINPSLH